MRVYQHCANTYNQILNKSLPYVAFSLKSSRWLNVPVFDGHVVNLASIFYTMQNILAQRLKKK